MPRIYCPLCATKKIVPPIMKRIANTKASYKCPKCGIELTLREGLRGIKVRNQPEGKERI